MKKLLIIVFCVMALGCGGGGGGGSGDTAPIPCNTGAWMATGQSNMVDYLDDSVPALFQEYLSELAGADIDVFRAAEGATYIDCWDGGRCFTEHILPLSAEDIVGVIWWQGESDAFTGTPGDEYYQHLTNLIYSFMDMFGDDLIVEIVELHSYAHVFLLPDPSGWQAIRDAQHRVAEEMDNVFIIESSDLTDGDLHPIESYDEIAYRLAEAAYHCVCN